MTRERAERTSSSSSSSLSSSIDPRTRGNYQRLSIELRQTDLPANAERTRSGPGPSATDTIDPRTRGKNVSDALALMISNDLPANARKELVYWLMAYGLWRLTRERAERTRAALGLRRVLAIDPRTRGKNSMTRTRSWTSSDLPANARKEPGERFIAKLTRRLTRERAERTWSPPRRAAPCPIDPRTRGKNSLLQRSRYAQPDLPANARKEPSFPRSTHSST